MNNIKEFVHLKIHTEYSIIDSTIKINNLIEKAKLLNMKYLAISDFLNFFGLIKFYEKCILNDIKPIICIEILVDNNDEYKESKLTLIAYNNNGYNDLLKLISNSYKNISTNNKLPIIKCNELFNFSKNIIVLSSSIEGYINKLIINNDFNKINKYINLYSKVFKDRFYIEISRIGIYNEEFNIFKSLEISKKFNIPLVATNNVVYLNKEDYDIHNIRVSINLKNNLYNKNKYTKEQFLKSSNDMISLFKDIPESIINSVEISKRCNVIIKFGNSYIPNYYKKVNSPDNYLKYISKKKIIEKIKKIKNKEVYNNRLNNELDIIKKTGFSNYFLIVMEFIQWAKKNNIPVGPGRGSGVGSLVSYLLDITEIDPIKFGLVFERFLNPDRKSIPDLDIDFCVEKRDLVINHVYEKYGKNHVSQIITFNRMTAKSAIKEVGRIMGYPYNFVDKISKIIPNFNKLPLSNIFNDNKLIELYNNDYDVKSLIDNSIKIEGIIKNIGKHAGGVVICPKNITDFIPLYFNSSNNNYYITQFDKYDIEKIGLVKFDFLGLKTLTIIKKTIDNINKKNKNDVLEISKINLNDKKSFNLLKKSNTNAVFQLESYGIKKIIKKINPNTFEDIIDLIALFRPGPLKSGMVEKFINRKNNKEKIYYPDKNYEHPILKEILINTYGIILYQEQIIKIAQKFSNYNLSEADLFRISISKKNEIEMNKQKEKFIIGAIKKNNIERNMAENIFNIIEKFSGYGFNKSHSVAYSLISYRTLWLKSNYPEEYMCSVMNCDINNFDKINILIKECKNMNIKINNIDINTSNYYFFVNNNNEIEYGIGYIKGISTNSINNILKNREKYGKYKDILEFLKRINLKEIGKKNLYILNEYNLFNNLINKKINNNDIDKYIKISENYFNNKNSNQINIFDTNNII